MKAKAELWYSLSKQGCTVQMSMCAGLCVHGSREGDTRVCHDGSASFSQGSTRRPHVINGETNHVRSLNEIESFWDYGKGFYKVTSKFFLKVYSEYF